METVDQAIQKAFTHAVRKTTMPVGAKYDALLVIADSVQRMWAVEEGVEWDTLYSDETIGTVSATDTFDLPDEVRTISKDSENPILITNGTSTTEYKLVKPNQLRRYRDSNVCAKVGRTLKFPKAFASDSSLIGYSIVIPAILKVDEITAGTDAIQVDDPMWFVYMMAAEFDRNDVIKVSQYDNLIALAGQHMNKMKEDNNGSLEEVTSGGFQAAGEDWN